MDKESRLKVYFGPDDRLQVNDEPIRSIPKEPQVVVAFGEIIESLQDAIATDRTWLRDFRDDQVTISKDLHDVLRAYRRYRKSA